MNAASTSKRRHSAPKRLYARKATSRPFLPDSDLRYFWAAYQMGMFRDYMDAGMSHEAFAGTLGDVLTIGLDWVLLARGDEGLRPVGFMLGRTFGSRRCLEPHIDWFPWATPRNKVEGISAWLAETQKQFKIFVFAELSDRPFWDRMKAYRILQAGCVIKDHFARGEHAMLYYTAGP